MSHLTIHQKTEKILLMTTIRLRQELPDGTDFYRVRETAAEVAHSMSVACTNGDATIPVTNNRTGKWVFIPVDLIGPIEAN